MDAFTFISRKFGFHEKWTNGVFRGFSSNANFAKDPCNVTSQIDTPRNVSRENTTTPEDFSKMSQKKPKLKVIIHAFGLSRAGALNATECLLGPWELIVKESYGWERIDGCPYVHFMTILGFTRNWHMGCLEAFPSYTNGAKHPSNIATSHADFPKNVSGENVTSHVEVLKCPKNSQNWRL